MRTKPNKNMAKTFELIHYYPRTHRVVANSVEEAKAIMEARRLKKSPTVCYSELWEIETETDCGEQIAFYENGAEFILLPK